MSEDKQSVETKPKDESSTINSSNDQVEKSEAVSSTEVAEQAQTEAAPESEPSQTQGEEKPADGLFGQWFGGSNTTNIWSKFSYSNALQQVTEQAQEAWAKYDGDKIKEKLQEYKEAAAEYLDDADRKLDGFESKLEDLETNAVNLLASSGSALINKVKEASQSIEGQKTTEEQSDNNIQPEVLFTDPDKTSISRLDSDLFKLHTSPEIILNKTNVPSIKLDETKNKLMKDSNPDLKQLYDSLVPSKLNEQEFWSRYLDLRNELEESNKRRKEIIEKENDDANDDDLDDWGSSGEDGN
ncbi:hypothetical protein DASB73_025030 [Starmerella bacillaris]|uniref:BSD domain-containing protein n=1 Tax=Starmerella bacillaris TaxID=1247836 RepID=A0AAV5RJK6_STABA|nr:hypothetical protein DASB73_025030 [Starmerella bacillaris]